MKVLIIEDELPSARRLERTLSEFEMEITGRLQSVKQSVKWFQNNEHPDVVFLDIHLADGLCFEIFNLVKVSSKIIFTTAYSNYSIKAFDYDSISYLLKPIKKVLLKEAIQKAKSVLEKENDLEKLKKIFSNYETEIYKTSFVVKNGGKIKIIKEEEINCFYSFDNATFIKTNNYKGILNHSLSHIENELNPKKFFRVNRTFIVQINAIKDIIAYTNSRLKIILNTYNEAEIIVSRERVKQFKEFIQ